MLYLVNLEPTWVYSIVYYLFNILLCTFSTMSSTISNNPKSFGERRTPLNALTAMIWLLYSLPAIACAQSSPNAVSIRNSISSRLFKTESLSAWSSKTEGVTVISGRNLSPDILASSVPVPAFRNNGKAGSHLNYKGLLLRSSSHNVSGIGQYPIFALPILSSELAEVLGKARADLQTRNNDMFASSYHVNTTKWSFIVVISNTTLHYASIKSVISRFLKLSSMTAAPQDIVSTRVGVILDGSIPVADITIMPYRTANNGSYIPFSDFGHYNLSISQPDEVVEITPFGSSCVHQVVNETTALAPFKGHDPGAEHHLTPRSLETEIFVRVGETIYAMSIHLWRRPDGLPVQMKIWALKAIISLCLSTRRPFSDWPDLLI